MLPAPPTGMFVAPDDAYAAVIVNAGPGQDVFDLLTMVVAADGTGVLKASGAGSEASRVLIKAGNGPATISVYDSSGTVVRELTNP